MPDFHIASADPLGLGVIDGSTAINVTNIEGGPKKEFHEVLSGDGHYIEAGVKELKPVEEWKVDYELLDGASLVLAFGAIVNVSYLITSAQVSCSAEARPTVSVSVIKPSAPGLVKAYATAITLTIAGGFGIVNKFGATSTGEFISSSASISMQTAEAMDEDSGNYAVAGIYHYGFKEEVTAEAYGAITEVAGSYVTDASTKESRDGWTTYSKSFWLYLDAIAA